jgi:hypothetical protein
MLWLAGLVDGLARLKGTHADGRVAQLAVVHEELTAIRDLLSVDRRGE